MAGDETAKTKEGQADKTLSDNIFDDVFRTIAQKLPFLMIPLINETFHTDYSMDQEYDQLRNEHYEKFGRIITDSIIRIGGHIYHLECQSSRDGDMVLRMFEYDFAIAIEHPSRTDDGIMEINFPESCVLYVRNHRNMPDHHRARIRFADGQTVTYSLPVIRAQDYTVGDILSKGLLVLLPYHILRYEHFLKTNSKDAGKTARLLDDMKMMSRELAGWEAPERHDDLYLNMVGLINEIAEYVIPDDNPIKGEVEKIMGGEVLKLASERCIEIGLEKGLERGRELELYSSVQDGDMLPERAAARLNIAVPVLRERMLANGYSFPYQH